jgi:alginate O-acetyltransferase complex protein AlgI
MVFSSPTFLFLFLPPVLGLYFAARGRGRDLVLIGAGVLFYAWGAGGFVAIVLLSTLADWWLARRIALSRARGAHDRARLLLLVGIVQNLGVLGYFKYLDFFTAQVTTGLADIGIGGRTTLNILLPIGVSFFTFEKISYVVDVARGDVEPRQSPVDVLLFVFLFPRSIAGPIVRLREIEDGLGRRPVRLDDLADGATRFAHGLLKKVVVADQVAPIANGAFPPGVNLTTTGAWAGVLAYTLQIYFDFSGYSDMAIGLAQVFGFRLPENFNRPYSAISITDFWRRWHMTLSRWFRDYVYIPLGGNRVSPFRTYVNLTVTFLLVGLWHGAQWTFVVWGAYHGSLLVVERLVKQRPTGDGHICWAPARRALTFLLVIVGWVFFRCASVNQAGTVLGRMFWPHGFAYGPGVELGLSHRVLFIGALGLLVTLMPRNLVVGRDLAASHSLRSYVARAALVTVGLGVALVLVVSGTFSPFLYFRF